MAAKREKTPDSYRERHYRSFFNSSSLVSFSVKIKDTDLYILADRDVTLPAENLALQFRTQVETYITEHPLFLHSLVPLPPDDLAPPLVREMLQAAERAGVGPMAAVAGTIAEYVGKGLLKNGCTQVMVENGGDLFLNRTSECRVGIYAGESPLSNRIGLRLPPGEMPLGICTSSGTVGHSLSFGKADSVTVISRSTSLADAVATRLGNEVKGQGKGDLGIKKVLETGLAIEGVLGVVVIYDTLMGAAGQVELIKVE